MTLISILFVAMGAAAGGILRFILSTIIKSDPARFPLATFIINLLGSFLLGIILSYSLKNNLDTNIKLLLTTGFCGGFTTFSTYSMESIQLFINGQYTLGVSYILGSVMGGIGMAALGYRLI